MLLCKRLRTVSRMKSRMKPRHTQNEGIKKELTTFVTSSNYLLMAERVGFNYTYNHSICFKIKMK